VGPCGAPPPGAPPGPCGACKPPPGAPGCPAGAALWGGGGAFFSFSSPATLTAEQVIPRASNKPAVRRDDFSDRIVDLCKQPLLSFDIRDLIVRESHFHVAVVVDFFDAELHHLVGLAEALDHLVFGLPQCDGLVAAGAAASDAACCSPGAGAPSPTSVLITCATLARTCSAERV